MESNTQVEPSTGRILLVEDVDAMRLYMRLKLEENGFEVLEADSLQTARQTLSAHEDISLVLLDLELPDGSGIDLLRHIPKDVPSIALSADVTMETTLRCKHAGCITVLEKSGELQKMIAILRKNIEQAPDVAEIDGKNSELDKLYREFLAETRLDIQSALEDYDLDGVRQLIHRLRGTAVHFGYVGIAENAGAVAQLLVEGDSRQMERSLERLTKQLVDAGSAT